MIGKGVLYTLIHEQCDQAIKEVEAIRAAVESPSTGDDLAALQAAAEPSAFVLLLALFGAWLNAA